MIDRDELRACMARKKLTQEDTARSINISTTAFRLKLIGKREFTEKEIKLLVDLFGNSIFSFRNDGLKNSPTN